MVENSFIERHNVVGTHWNCIMYLQHVTKNGNLHLPSIMCIVFVSFKHPKLPISTKIPVTLQQIVYICMTAVSPNLSS